MVQTQGISQKVAIGDPAYPSHVIKPNVDGSVRTESGSGTGISSTVGVGNLVSLTGATIANGSITISANGQSAIVDAIGFEGAAFTVSGYGAATIDVEWSNLPSLGFVAGLIATVGTTTTGVVFPGNGQFTAAAGGRYMKINTSGFSSGPIVITPVLLAGGISSGGSSGGGGGDATAANQVVQIGVANTSDATLTTIDAVLDNIYNDTTPASVQAQMPGVVTPTCDTGAIVAGDVLTDTFAITNLTGQVDLPSVLETAILIDGDDQKLAMDLWLFDSNVSLGTKNSPPNISDADAAHIVGRITVVASDWYDLGGVSVAVKTPIANMVAPASTTKTVYGSIIVQGSGTYTASGLKLRFGAL